MKSETFLIFILIIAVGITGCETVPVPEKGYTPTNATMREPGDKSGILVVKDDTKGKGRFMDIILTHPLNQNMAVMGKAIFTAKCIGCHKLTDDKLVGPGWKGITDLRKPEWIMNFETNTDEMLNTDPAASAMLEKYIVRMPNPQLNDDDARKLLEFMRYNDGKN